MLTVRNLSAILGWLFGGANNANAAGITVRYEQPQSEYLGSEYLGSNRLNSGRLWPDVDRLDRWHFGAEQLKQPYSRDARAGHTWGRYRFTIHWTIGHRAGQHTWEQSRA